MRMKTISSVLSVIPFRFLVQLHNTYYNVIFMWLDAMELIFYWFPTQIFFLQPKYTNNSYNSRFVNSLKLSLVLFKVFIEGLKHLI